MIRAILLMFVMALVASSQSRPTLQIWYVSLPGCDGVVKVRAADRLAAVAAAKVTVFDEHSWNDPPGWSRGTKVLDYTR